MSIDSVLFYKLLNIGQIKLSNKNIVLQETLLGWILTDDRSTKNNNQLSLQGRKSCYLITNIEDEMAKFWEFEEIPLKIICHQKIYCVKSTSKRP